MKALKLYINLFWLKFKKTKYIVLNTYIIIRTERKKNTTSLCSFIPIKLIISEKNLFSLINSGSNKLDITGIIAPKLITSKIIPMKTKNIRTINLFL